MEDTNEQTINVEVEFDFDVLMELTKNNPEEFEIIRQKIISDFIQSLPEDRRHRMECLQWRIDQVRAKAKNPLASCMAITEMMWQSFEKLNALFMEMKKSETSGSKAEPMQSADIIPIRMA